MKKKYETPEKEAQAKGCGLGCVSYIVLALILALQEFWLWVIAGLQTSQ